MENNGKQIPMADGILRHAMDDLAAALDRVLNGEKVEQTGERKNGFVLLLFPYDNTSGYCHYVSNGADRDTVIRMFRAQIKLFEEAKMEKPPTDAEAEANMARINAICADFNERKIDRAEARRRLEEGKIAYGIDQLLDSYDPDIP